MQDVKDRDIATRECETCLDGANQICRRYLTGWQCLKHYWAIRFFEEDCKLATKLEDEARTEEESRYQMEIEWAIAESQLENSCRQVLEANPKIKIKIIQIPTTTEDGGDNQDVGMS